MGHRALGPHVGWSLGLGKAKCSVGHDVLVPSLCPSCHSPPPSVATSAPPSWCMSRHQPALQAESPHPLVSVPLFLVPLGTDEKAMPPSQGHLSHTGTATASLLWMPLVLDVGFIHSFILVSRLFFNKNFIEHLLSARHHVGHRDTALKEVKLTSVRKPDVKWVTVPTQSVTIQTDA